MIGVLQYLAYNILHFKFADLTGRMYCLFLKLAQNLFKVKMGKSKF